MLSAFIRLRPPLPQRFIITPKGPGAIRTPTVPLCFNPGISWETHQAKAADRDCNMSFTAYYSIFALSAGEPG